MEAAAGSNVLGIGRVGTKTEEELAAAGAVGTLVNFDGLEGILQNPNTLVVKKEKE